MDRCNTAALLAALVFGARPTSAQSPARLSESYAKLPVVFEPNIGQFDPQVRYASRSQGHTLFLTDREIVLTFSSSTLLNNAVRMSFSGSNSSPAIEPSGHQPGVSNYLRGNDCSKWRTDVPHYGRVRYGKIYPGVDLVFYGSGSDLEFDLAVQPGADPSAIRFALSGTDGLAVDHAGDLVAQAGGREFRLRKPTVYQEAGGERVPVRASYRVLHGTNVIQVKLGAYDSKRMVVIDPILSLGYSTYLGGTASDQANGIAVDASGSAYVTGFANSLDFPLTAPLQGTNKGAPDVFITKLNPAGNALVYSTYLGGSGADKAFGIALDSNGDAYIAGSTSSSDFPTMNPLQANLAGGTDAFVAELNASGSGLIYSTYLGGSGNDSAAGIAVDSTGAAAIAGTTASTNFPLANPQQGTQHGQTNAFIAKLNAGGSALLYSTYFGGSSNDNAAGVAIDGTGNTYVVGSTTSANFPTAAPLQPACGRNAFVLKLSPTGFAIYSTCLGGSGTDYGNAIAVDASGNAYVAGGTSSLDFPVVNAVQPKHADSNLGGVYGRDVFVAKLNAAGSALVYSTYLGGIADPVISIQNRFPQGDDFASGIAVDVTGNAYVTGSTKSPAFPVSNSLQAYDGPITGVGLSPIFLYDAFAANFSPSGALIYSTFLGGRLDDNGNAIAIDSQGNAYLAGSSESIDFPVANAFQAANQVIQAANGCYAGCATNAFIAKLSIGPGVRVSFTSALPGSITVTGQGCSAGTYTLPASLSWTATASCTIAVTGQSSGGTQYVFASWADGPLANPRTISAPANSVTYSINFSTQYLLTTSVSPAGAGTISATPPSANGYYNAGTPVTLTAAANLGYDFSFFSGNLIGSPNPQTLTMSMPQTVAATFKAAVGCGFGLSVGGQAFTPAGGTGSVNVTANPGCAWAAIGAPAWVTFTSGDGSGTGNGVVNFTVAANSGGGRTATLTIAGVAYTIQQEAASIPGLSFIGSIPHLAGEENWTTSFTLVNKGASSATARLSFFGDDNSYSSDLNGSGPLALPFAFPQQPGAAGPLLGASFDQTLAANASFFAISAGSQSPPVQVGSAQLSATGAVDGFAIFHQIVTQQEAVVPLETRNAGSYLLPFDNTNGLGLGVALANISGQAAVVHVVVRDDTGAQIPTGSLPQLTAGGHFQFELATQFPVTANKRGTIEFDTPIGGQISVLGLRFTPPNHALTTIPALANVGTGGGSIAHIASGDGWQTTFVLVNTGTSSAQATLSFFADQTGAPLSLPLTFPQGAITATAAPSVTQTLLPGATLLIASTGARSLLTGSAQLGTTGNVSGFVILRHNDQEAAVPLESRNVNGYLLAFDNTKGTATGIAVNAVSTGQVNIPVTIRNESGTQIATDTIALNANGHTQFTLATDKYPMTADIRGTIEFDTPAGAQIGALGIRMPTGAAHTYTTLPALAK